MATSHATHTMAQTQPRSEAWPLLVRRRTSVPFCVSLSVCVFCADADDAVDVAGADDCHCSRAGCRQTRQHATAIGPLLFAIRRTIINAFGSGVVHANAAECSVPMIPQYAQIVRLQRIVVRCSTVRQISRPQTKLSVYPSRLSAIGLPVICQHRAAIVCSLY